MDKKEIEKKYKPLKANVTVDFKQILKNQQGKGDKKCQ